MPTTAIMLRVRVLTVCYLGNPELIIHNLEHGHCPTHTRQLTTAHTAAEVTLFLPAPATTPATRRNVAELWTLTRGVINISQICQNSEKVGFHLVAEA